MSFGEVLNTEAHLLDLLSAFSKGKKYICSCGISLVMLFPFQTVSPNMETFHFIKNQCSDPGVSIIQLYVYIQLNIFTESLTVRV